MHGIISSKSSPWAAFFVGLKISQTNYMHTVVAMLKFTT